MGLLSTIIGELKDLIQKDKNPYGDLNNATKELWKDIQELDSFNKKLKLLLGIVREQGNITGPNFSAIYAQIKNKKNDIETSSEKVVEKELNIMQDLYEIINDLYEKTNLLVELYGRFKKVEELENIVLITTNLTKRNQ